MKKRIEYSGHLIDLIVVLASGSKTVDEEMVLTNTLQANIDEVILLSKDNLTDDELIAQIPIVQGQAEKRIDIIGTPADSPLADILLGMGFSF